MKALILVGGYGTRLRPLTINFPKSAFPFINRPLVEHQIQALSKVGVVEVIIAINYQADHIKKSLEPLQEKYKIKLTYSQETEAMGTAGPLKLAEKHLRQGNKEGLFFTLNSDIICDFPLEKLLEVHKAKQAEGTLVLAEVSDPSRFGVIVTKNEGLIDQFVEKPKHFVSNKINAGIYLLNLSVLDRIPLKFSMLETDVFPQMAKEGKLHSLPLQNKFWFDTGKPEDYLVAQGAYLDYYKIKSEKSHGGNLIDKTAVIEDNCNIGPNVVIGANCVIKSGTRLKNCTILAGTIIGIGCHITNAVISWRCKIGSWVRIEGLTCIAEQVVIKDETRLTECMVLSHKNVGGIHYQNVLL